MRRIIPINKISNKKFRFFVFTSAFLSISATLFFSNLYLRSYLVQNFTNTKSDFQSAEPVLGHFPYQEVSKDDLETLYPGFELHRDTLEALLKMKKAAEADGVYLVFLSGYRSIDLQRSIFTKISQLEIK